MKFRSIELENCCGYRKATFDLNSGLNVFFGPNGCGKSNILYIANILASPQRFMGRDVSMIFRKMIFHRDYNPGYQAYDNFDDKLSIIGNFYDEKGEYKVRIEIDPEKVKLMDEMSKDAKRMKEYAKIIKEIGVVQNELPNDKLEYALLTDADSPAHMAKFQIEKEAAEVFLDIAKAVYGYDCYLEQEVEDYDSQTKEYVTYYTDFVIVKKDDGPGFPEVRVHYRRMSDGERKIATLLKQLASPMSRNRFDIYLVDNIEMHIYMARHKKLVDKLLQHFPEKQFLATSHSPILVGTEGIEPYLKPENLQDVIAIRRNESSKPSFMARFYKGKVNV